MSGDGNRDVLGNIAGGLLGTLLDNEAAKTTEIDVLHDMNSSTTAATSFLPTPVLSTISLMISAFVIPVVVDIILLLLLHPLNGLQRYSFSDE